MIRISKDRIARLVKANTPEQLAKAYLNTRARAEAAEAKLDAIKEKVAGGTRKDTARHSTLGDIDIQGDPETVAALKTLIGGM